jgi:ribose transport system permease protein
MFIGVILICWYVLNKTKFGRYVYAVGGNETTANYSGIQVDKIKIMTYGLIGLLVGIASVIETARLASVSSSTSGLYYEMDAIAAVIIGGTPMSGGKGKISGTVVGIIILGVIGNIMNLINISPYLDGAVKGIIILIAVLVQKRGN